MARGKCMSLYATLVRFGIARQFHSYWDPSANHGSGAEIRVYYGER